MVLAMSRPLRCTDTSFIHFRKRVPADILRLAKAKTFTFVIPRDDPNEPEVVATVTLNAEMKFSLRTRDPSIAKLRTGLATAQFERYCDGLRNGPRPLTHKEIIALSGLIYRERIQRWQDDPGDPQAWEIAMDNEVDAMGSPQELEKQFGGEVDYLLAREGIVTDAKSRRRLLEEVASASASVASQLVFYANGE